MNLFFNKKNFYLSHSVAMGKSPDMISEMKKFALFLPNTDQAQIIEGSSAAVTKKKDGLRVVINSKGDKIIFNKVVIFCEVSPQITIEQ